MARSLLVYPPGDLESILNSEKGPFPDQIYRHPKDEADRTLDSLDSSENQMGPFSPNTDDK